MIEIKKIGDFQTWSQYAEDWNNLLATSSSNHIFLTYEWLSAWWELFGTDKELAIILAFEKNVLVGAAPLCLTKGRVLKVLRFLGSQVVFADLLNFLIPSGREREILPLMMDFLLAKVPWDKIFLNEMEDDPKLLEVLKTWADNNHFLYALEKNDVSPCLPIADTLEGFHRKMDPVFWRGLQKSGLRRLQRDHQVEFRIAIDREEIDRTMETLFQLHTERWDAVGKKGQFDLPDKREFYKNAARKLALRGWLRLSSLKVDGNEEAVLLGVQFSNDFYALQLGCGLQGQKLKAGNVLIYRILESLIGRGKHFHFLKGNEGYKYKWGAVDLTHTINFSLFRGWKGKGRFWLGRVLDPLRFQGSSIEI
jgi:CelD/BcsL family acetyltransferase involved in cellulose biosynthesis